MKVPKGELHSSAGVTFKNGISGASTLAKTLTISPRNCHTGSSPAKTSTDGTDTTPSATTTYIAEVFVPANAMLTGVAVLNGSAVSGNIKIGLADSTGVVVASSISTTQSGTNAYQRVPFAVGGAPTPYKAVGPATYYVLQQVDNGTARIRTHTVGNFGADTKTLETYGSFTAITPPTTFANSGRGPIASLY